MSEHGSEQRMEIERLRVLVAVRDLEIQELKYGCTHDGLTHMFNRLGFESTVGVWIAEGVEVLTLGILDLDEFKMVNDTQGHAAGDRLLCDVGKQISAIAEAHHGIAARLSGDEFVIAVPGEDTILAKQVVDTVDGCDVSMGLVIGLAVAVSRLMWCADVAMYHSKHQTGSSVTIYKEGDRLPAEAHASDRRKRNRTAPRHTWHGGNEAT